MLKLQIVTVSTREGRKGPVVASWFTERARAHGKFDIEEVDLATVNLPMFNEPQHPSQQKYAHEHTKAWSAIVDRADAYVFVTPEYNFGTPPSLVNALNYLVKEWQYKPAAFVSYGGVSAGLRGVQMTKQVMTTLKIVPLFESVAIPFFTQHIDKETNAFTPGEVQEKSANTMLNELHRWADTLKPMRARP